MDIEAKAREQGWNPDYEGPNKTDAKTFVEKGEKITGILKSRVDRQQRQIESLQKTNREFGEHTKKQLDKSRQENESLLQELEAKRAQAITDSDGPAYTEIDREIETVRSDLNGNEPRSNPEADLWLVDNDWYNTNQKLHFYADGVSDAIVSEGYTGPAYWQELTRRTEAAHPEEFTNPNRAGSNSVESGGDKEVKDTSKESYENLPPDAKAKCDEWVANGVVASKEDYVAIYEWRR